MTPGFALSFTRRFAMGHRLIAGTSERCALPHGHNELVTVHLRAVEARPLDGQANMIVPFERAKATWHRFIDDHLDHALQLAEGDPLLAWFAAHEPERARRIVVTPGDPTTELMACLLMAKANAFLDRDATGLVCAAIELQETPTNTVRFAGDPASALPRPNPPGACWWHRADMTISDPPGRIDPVADGAGGRRADTTIA